MKNLMLLQLFVCPIPSMLCTLIEYNDKYKLE